MAEAAELSGKFDIVGFLDDAICTDVKLLGYPVLGPLGNISKHREACDQVIVAIGNNEVREALMQGLMIDCIEIATVIHPRAIVSPRAVVGVGVSVMAGAVVGTEAGLGKGVIVNCGAVVEHQARVEDYGHLGVNACMAGGSVLGRCSWMKAGSSLGPNVVIPGGVGLRPGESIEHSPENHIDEAGP